MSAFRGSRDKPLPGWKKDGKQNKKAWEGENLKKETFKLWVHFNKDNFEDGGEPAGLEGAAKVFRLQGPRQERRGAMSVGNPALGPPPLQGRGCRASSGWEGSTIGSFC